MKLTPLTAVAMLVASAAAADEFPPMPPIAPAGPDLIAEIRAAQEEAAARTRQGFTDVKERLNDVRDRFKDVREGFARVESEFHRAIKRDMSIAALAAIPDQGADWSAGVGVAVDGRYGAPGAAVALQYATDRHAFRLAVSGPEVVLTLGFSAKF